MQSGRFVRWAAVAVFALMMVQGVAVRSVAAAGSGAACAGLSAYRGELLAAGRTWVKGMRSDDLLGRSTRDYDATDWAAYSARAKQLLSDLEAVDPPAFAAQWHEAQIEAARLRLNFAGWATLLGFDATAEVFGPKVAAVTEETLTGKEQASAVCDRFPKLANEWAHLDGQEKGTSESSVEADA